MVYINHLPVRIPRELSGYFSLIKNNPCEESVVSFLRQRLKDGGTVIDIGANIGLISLFIARIVGEHGRVIVFEPNPYMIDGLVYILGNNLSYRNYSVFQMALSDRKSVAAFNIESGKTLMERSSLLNNKFVSKQITVLTSDLDSLLPDDIIPDLIKIDVEGAELSVLTGMKHLLQRNRFPVLVEIHGNYFSNPTSHVEAVFNYFTSMNYAAYNILSDKIESSIDFLKNSGISALDPETGEALNSLGYGHICFFPKEMNLPKV